MVGLLGVDDQSLYLPALRLLGRLDFSDMEWHFVHFQPAFSPIGMPLDPTDDLVDAISREREFAEHLLDGAADQACAYNISAKTHLTEGSAGRGMLALSDDMHVDLTAIGSRQPGSFASAILGSVGRALTIGSRGSVLIGRGSVPPSGRVKAVFATDHSEYCRRALHQLISMHPRGFEKIVLVTAYDVGEDVEDLKSKSGSWVTKLREAGFAASYELKPGKVDDVIHRALQEHPSELLILGAQGHGFMERMIVGSTALHQVMREHPSLLILRPTTH